MGEPAAGRTAGRTAGRNAERVLVGGVNPRAGRRLATRAGRQRQDDSQAFLRHPRRRYPGRPRWPPPDRASCHEAFKRRALAGPTAGCGCAERNPVGHPGRGLKRLMPANRQFRTIDEAADYAGRWPPGLTPRQALRKAGILADDSWLEPLLRRLLPTY